MSLITLTPFLSRILVTFVCLFIFFLAYPSQYFLLQNRAYAPWWSSVHAAWFNFCVASIWVAYYRSVNTDPGRLPDGWLPDGVDDLVEGTAKEGDDGSEHKQRKLWGKSVGRWCKKCQGWKPPRCHHCRKCGRCVLRMDHHCPWTNNCVGYLNLPHFLRFICWTTYTAIFLEYHLVSICLELWDLPSIYSPPLPTLTLLIISLICNTFATFSITLLTLRTLQSTSEGTTTIEEWEKERHANLVRRKVIRRVIFPWDIGMWENMVEVMGGEGVGFWWWWWVGQSNRKVWKKENGVDMGNEWDWERDGGGGVKWEVNGFEDPSTPWPPPDPERDFIRHRKLQHNHQLLPPPVMTTTALDEDEYVAAFRKRQEKDLLRWRRRRSGSGSGSGSGDGGDDGSGDSGVIESKNKVERRGQVKDSWDGVWRNEDGATLEDYGVDEDAEGELGVAGLREESVSRGEAKDDDEDCSLAELLRRRKRRQA